MPDYIDPRRSGMIAVVLLIIYAVAQLVELASITLAANVNMVVGSAAIILLVAMIAANVAVLFWVYRVNANAHTLADGLSITPGWNIGWFFVPLANLWKPFEGIKETWQASENAAEWPGVAVPGLLYGWWGCWLVGNMLDNAALWRGAAHGDPTLADMKLVSSALLIAAAAFLARIIMLLSPMQQRARAIQTFA